MSSFRFTIAATLVFVTQAAFTVAQDKKEPANVEKLLGAWDFVKGPKDFEDLFAKSTFDFTKGGKFRVLIGKTPIDIFDGTWEVNEKGNGLRITMGKGDSKNDFPFHIVAIKDDKLTLSLVFDENKDAIWEFKKSK